MADFYVAVPSYASPEFPNNTRASFKVRLADRIEFPDDEWEVALSALSLADTSADLSPLVQDPHTRLLSSEVKWKDKLGADHDDSVWVEMEEINKLNVTRRLEDGVEFVRAMLDTLTSKENVEHLKNDGQITARVRYEWDTSRGRTELILKGKVRIQVDETLGLKMGWLAQPPGGNVEVGPNAIPEAEYDKTGDPYWTAKKTFLTKNALLTRSEGPANILYKFNEAFDWRLVNLEEAFRNVMGEPSRTLHVYSDVGGSTIVGNRKTDLLREVTYTRAGRGTVYYEPLHKQYHRVRNRTIEVVEINVSETNGQLVRFPKDGRAQTFVTLHFRSAKKRV